MKQISIIQYIISKMIVVMGQIILKKKSGDMNLEEVKKY